MIAQGIREAATIGLPGLSLAPTISPELGVGPMLPCACIFGLDLSEDETRKNLAVAGGRIVHDDRTVAREERNEQVQLVQLVQPGQLIQLIQLVRTDLLISEILSSAPRKARLTLQLLSDRAAPIPCPSGCAGVGIGGGIHDLRETWSHPYFPPCCRLLAWFS